MASRVAIAIRKEEALARIASATGTDIGTAHRDRDVAVVLQLEAIADAVEARGAAPTLASAIAIAKVDDLTAFDGVGDKLAAALIEQAAQMASAPADGSTETTDDEDDDTDEGDA